MTVPRPIYCPNCTTELAPDDGGASPFTIINAPVAQYLPHTDGFECFCDACHWSGDILPDDVEMTPWKEWPNGHEHFRNADGCEFELEGDLIRCLQCNFAWSAEHRTKNPDYESCPECGTGRVPKP